MSATSQSTSRRRDTIRRGRDGLNLPWEAMADTEAARRSNGQSAGSLRRARGHGEREAPATEDTTIAVWRWSTVQGSQRRRLGARGTAAVRRDGIPATRRPRGRRRDARVLAGHVAATAYDVLHFSGHGGFLPGRPGLSGLQLADGPLLTRSIVDLPWQKPPYLAITSAC
ncbi:MAG: CHAT domain-containing protein [Actinobacteria bacterium]|nr:CHAT domain-containing protein [Actinomycetota bacterium]